jgi:predicted TIM-barrel fold metal-dependent hydrolase
VPPTPAEEDFPAIISVDDHVVEPRLLWQQELPARWREKGPRTVREKVRLQYVGGVYSFERDVDDGRWCDVWLFDDLVYPTGLLHAPVGYAPEDIHNLPATYEDFRPGAYEQGARLADMSVNHVEAAMCFPNVFPRFCGQGFAERVDKELSLASLRIYNDWMIDEWCGAVPGRQIPLIILPLWDPTAAAREIERCAAKGARGLAFSENPEPLGLPTIHDPARYWDPVMAAAQDTETIVCMHVGSSSTMPSICSDAPALANLTFGAVRAAGTMLSWIFSDYFERMPNLKIALSEGNIGWMPYFLERAEQVVDKQRHWISKTSVQLYDQKAGDSLQADLSRLDVRQVFRDHIFGCFIEETSGLMCLDILGDDNIMIETDYPHSDTTWPDCISVAKKLVEALPPESQYKILRGNAERLFRFTPAEPTGAPGPR